MSFNAEIRKVRDRGRPHGARVKALAHCLEIYSPIGFQETWDYLQTKAGPFRTSEDALLAAADLLEHSRRLYLAELAAYVEVRRRQKASGQRSPRPGEVTPLHPPRWHAAPADAAVAVLRQAIRDGELSAVDDPGPGGDLRRLVEAFLRHGTADTGQLAGLHGWLTAARKQLTYETFQARPASHRRASSMIRLATHLRVAVGDY